MGFTPASHGSVAVFLALAVAIVASFIAAIRASERHDGVAPGRRVVPASLALGVWLVALSAASGSGLLAASPMPRLVFFFAAINAVSLGAGLSPVGRWIAAAVPVRALVAFQGFRLPLELVLHSWAGSGTIPETMTWTGQNWDIITGSVSLVAAPFAGRFRALAWFANVLGFALLMNVLRAAVLSSPLPFAWQVEPPLLLAFQLPYMLIAPVCVGGALFGHVVLTRALLGSPPEPARTPGAGSGQGRGDAGSD
jgi:hypothetical protein